MKPFQRVDDPDDLAQLEDILTRLRSRLSAPPRAVTIDAAGWFALRRRRDLVFGDHRQLFSEPAWDILLALRIAEQGGRRETVGSVGIAAGCPTTTASRYVAELVKQGLVVREDDPVDARRCYLAPSARGAGLVDRTLATMPAAEMAPFLI